MLLFQVAFFAGPSSMWCVASDCSCNRYAVHALNALNFMHSVSLRVVSDLGSDVEEGNRSIPFGLSNWQGYLFLNAIGIKAYCPLPLSPSKVSLCLRALTLP